MTSENRVLGQRLSRFFGVVPFMSQLKDHRFYDLLEKGTISHNKKPSAEKELAPLKKYVL